MEDPRDRVVALFHAFYLENADKLFMSKSYPINWPEILRWKQHLTDPDSKILGEAFISALQHVSFTQFYDALVKGAISVPSSRIILVINGSMLKSSAWVALLVWPFINNKVVDIIQPHEMRPDIPDTHMYVYVDDAVYSAKQFEEVVPKDLRTRIYLLSGAISSSDPTQKRIGSIGSEVMQSDYAIRFRSVYSHAFHFWPSLFETNADAQEWSDRLEAQRSHKFQYAADKHCIYFDHKLADAVSILQKMIALGVDDVYEDLHFHPLIINCDPEDYKFYGTNVRNAHDKVTDFDPDGVCPPVFYKGIDYTWKGSFINKKLHITEILAISDP